MRKLMLMAVMMAVSPAMALAGASILMPETTWDFGLAYNTKSLSHPYWIKNTGDDTLSIDVKPGCGCTLAPIQKNRLAPGDSTVVELIFNARTVMRPPLPVKKSATVSSNDQTQSRLSINFTSRIIPDSDTVSTIAFGPRLIEFSPDNRKAEIEFENIDDSLSLTATQIGYLMDDFNIDIPKKPLKPGKKDKIMVEWKGEKPEYDVDRSLTFDTGSQENSRFSVSYTIKGVKGPKQAPAKSHAATPATVKPATSQKPTFDVSAPQFEGGQSKVTPVSPAATDTLSNGKPSGK